MGWLFLNFITFFSLGLNRMRYFSFRDQHSQFSYKQFNWTMLLYVSHHLFQHFRLFYMLIMQFKNKSCFFVLCQIFKWEYAYYIKMKHYLDLEWVPIFGKFAIFREKLRFYAACLMHIFILFLMFSLLCALAFIRPKTKLQSQVKWIFKTMHSTI